MVRSLKYFPEKFQAHYLIRLYIDSFIVWFNCGNLYCQDIINQQVFILRATTINDKREEFRNYKCVRACIYATGALFCNIRLP